MTASEAYFFKKHNRGLPPFLAEFLSVTFDLPRAPICRECVIDYRRVLSKSLEMPAVLDAKYQKYLQRSITQQGLALVSAFRAAGV